jgi:hypothetical protein
MQNKLVLALLMTALITASAFALDIEGKAPTLSGTNANTINGQLNAAFESALGELQNELKDIKSTPEELIKAFGNAGIFASHGATQRAYGGYKTFAVTFGPMFGLQIPPGNPLDMMNDLDSVFNKFQEDKDIKLGLNPQILNVNLGINTSKFLIKDLYLGLHFGFMKLDDGLLQAMLPEGFSFGFDIFSLGATANYQLLAPQSLAGGLIHWRGINVGSGFIWQKTSISAGLGLSSLGVGPFEQDFSGTGTVTIDPTLSLDFTIDTFVVPIEVTTAVRLLWFLNIPLGIGVDLGFGKSDLKVGMDAKIKAELTGYQQESDGYLKVSAGGDMAPSFFNLKAMTGIGLNLGPVLIDIPLTYYFIDNGFSVGLTLGVVW